MDDIKSNCAKWTPSLYQDILRNIALYPGQLAFSDRNVNYTWLEFSAKVDSVARKLESFGVADGDVVSVYMQNSTEFPVCLYAIWRLGAIFAPINSRLSAVEGVRMAEDVSAKLIIVDKPNIKSDILIRQSRELVAGVSDCGSNCINVVSASHPAWLFFTSGTSGTPKAAVLTHSQLNSVVSNGLVDLMMGRLVRTDKAMAVAPLSHGALTHLLRQVRLGGETYIYSESHYDESQVLRDILDRKIRSVFLVPTMVKRLCDAAEGAECKGSLTALLCGGEPLARELIKSVEKVFGRVLVNYYGLAEVTGAISQANSELIHQQAEDSPVTAGVSRSGTAIQIRDEDSRPVAHGVRGSIWVAGENVFSGYLVKGKLDRSVIVDGWYNTKDMGYLDINGLLYIDGRSTDMFISGGSNVYPQEIERVLRQLSWVGECAVVGVPDSKWGEIGVAFITSDELEFFDEKVCIDTIRKHLGSYKVPKYFVPIPELPKTAMNKIDRKQLQRIGIEKHKLS